MNDVFELCPNPNCENGELWHYGKRDALRIGICPDCGGTGKIVIADKEKEAMIAFILEIATSPIGFGKNDSSRNEIIIKAQKFLKQLPNEYLKGIK